MPVLLTPYLSFRNTARAATEFYRGVLGGELHIMTFAQGGITVDPTEAELVMHAYLGTPNGMHLMGSDVPSHLPLDPGGSVEVALTGDDEPTLRGYWDGLADGASIGQPLAPAPWGDTFGMLTDRFGVRWLVNITGGS